MSTFISFSGMLQENFFLVGIEPLRKKELISLIFWWYTFSNWTQIQGKLLYYKFIIHNNVDNLMIFQFVDCLYT